MPVIPREEQASTKATNTEITKENIKGKAKVKEEEVSFNRVLRLISTN